MKAARLMVVSELKATPNGDVWVTAEPDLSIREGGITKGAVLVSFGFIHRGPGAPSIGTPLRAEVSWEEA